MHEFDKKYMSCALLLAKKCKLAGEVPVGAVIEYKGKIIGRGMNMRETFCNPLAHAEISALLDASKKLKTRRLSRCTMYVTLEPCFMCLGAIVGSGIEGLVYSACRYEFFKSKESSFDLAFKLGRFLKTKKGILAFESSKLLKEFFCDLRNQQSQTLKVYKNKIKEKKKYE